MSQPGDLNVGQAATLALADGSTWGIVGADAQASAIVSRLKETMQLQLRPDPARRLFVLTGSAGADLTVRASALSEDEETVICTVSPDKKDALTGLELMRISQVICKEAQIRGGMLLHGALAERHATGVILAGPGGVGKTTASQRLPAPWRALCDDASLIVRDEQGVYWAHPWPTWSRFFFGRNGGSWDVQHAVPLKAIFFLAQAPQDHVEPVGAGQAACLLLESAEQAARGSSHGAERDELRVQRRQRFDSVCALAQAVPTYLLHLSPRGSFWREIERTVVEAGEGAS